MSTRTRVPNIISKDYLINGKIQTWKGPQAQVYSHIVLDDEDQPTLIGEVPDMDGDIALKALDAAVNAYGRGQGKWPTMKVKERIRCVETFVQLMADHRKEVVELLMWEIGKNKADATKEFDELIIRLKERGEESPEKISMRVAKAPAELATAPLFDKIVLNKDLDKALTEAYELVSNFVKD